MVFRPGANTSTSPVFGLRPILSFLLITWKVPKFEIFILNTQKVVKSNCLATLNPELAKEWHPTKNNRLTP